MKDHQQTSVTALTAVIERYEADGVSKQAAVRDLLTDLRHYCQAKRLDFYQALDGSYDVYSEERYEDQQDHRQSKARK